MKYILMLAAALLFSACSSTGHHHAHGDHGKHHAHGEGKSECGDSCDTKKSDCDGACDVKKEEKKSDCGCDASAGDTVKAAAAAATPVMAKEEITKLYTANKAKLGKSCSPAASAYCGKVTRDLNVTEDELSCLVDKVYRTTKDALPKLDNSECAKMIKKIAKK